MIDIWQHIGVGAIIAGAAVYVVRRSWAALRGRSSGCGIGCSSCPAAKQGEKVVVQLRELHR